jgi:hypothetical protein
MNRKFGFISGNLNVLPIPELSPRVSETGFSALDKKFACRGFVSACSSCQECDVANLCTEFKPYLEAAKFKRIPNLLNLSANDIVMKVQLSEKNEIVNLVERVNNGTGKI